MPLKPDAKPWKILEQIISDPVSGLTFQFEVPPDGDPRLRIYATAQDSQHALDYGNRDLVFKDGKFTGAGTNVRDGCKPGWITDMEVEPTGEGSIPKFPCSRKEFEEGNDG